MNQDRTKRKLTAIFSADVVGYSRLMEEDEAWTIKSLEENKSLISKLIEEYKGRVVDAPGDNVLAEFSSVTNAVECAVKIQQELKKKNANIVENRRMEFRIGINLGEVVEEGGRIYGSGVNIAARIEGLSKSGGICISGRTYDHIKTKFDFGYEYLGEHNVKNISEPIRVYRLLTDPESAGKVIEEKKRSGRMSRRINIATFIILIIIAAGLTGWIIHSHQSRKIEPPPVETEQIPSVSEAEKAKKSIAVLPFEDLSPESDQRYFVDGLSEEILNSLTQIPDLLVSGRTSSFSFKGSDKKLQEIANELGVAHILEGSVRKAGNALRITAQLLRATDGFHLWSKTYDRELKDIFEVQEDIATAVADELRVTLGIGESLKQLGGTNNLEAYELYLVAKGHYNNVEYSQALESIDAAVALDPEYALAWAIKANIHLSLSASSPSELVTPQQDAALHSVQRAIELEPDLAGKYYSIYSTVKMFRGDFIGAESDYRKILELTNESGSFKGGIFYLSVGYINKANELFEQARQSDPLNQTLRGFYLCSFGFLGDMPRAEKEYERGRALFSDQWDWGDLAITWLRLGTGNVVTRDQIMYSDDPACDAVKEHLDSPKEALIELHKIYSNYDNPEPSKYADMSVWAAYAGDAEFAMEAMEKHFSIDYSRISFIWFPIMREVRKTPRFKELIKEIGLFDYWQQYGWPDLCRPVGDDDFECE
jgi:adenylate cyclase